MLDIKFDKSIILKYSSMDNFLNSIDCVECKQLLEDKKIKSPLSLSFLKTNVELKLLNLKLGHGLRIFAAVQEMKQFDCKFIFYIIFSSSPFKGYFKW